MLSIQQGWNETTSFILFNLCDQEFNPLLRRETFDTSMFCILEMGNTRVAFIRIGREYQ